MITFYNLDTFNEYVSDSGLENALMNVINTHSASRDVRTAKMADKYAARENVTICDFMPYYYDIVTGQKRADTYKPNHHLCNNYFDYLNSQRCNFSLGAGVSFDKDDTLSKLGEDFSEIMSSIGYYSLIHGCSFLFWDVDHCHQFKFTEFAPIMDYENNRIVAGVRYWKLNADAPLIVEYYEEDGYTKLRKDSKKDAKLQVIEPKRAYKVTLSKADIDEAVTIVGEENYSVLPIFVFYGNKHHVSTLPGMRGELDAIDLGMSGIVNNMTDAQSLLTIISGYDGMNDSDLIKLQDWMRTQGIVQADEGSINIQSIDHGMTEKSNFINQLQNFCFEQFGGLDVHTIMAGQTNDHIAAAYEPLNAKADEFEDEMTKGMRPLLRMLNIDDAPVFNRKALANETEIINAVLSEYEKGLLDKETALRKLPNVDNEEIENIMAKLDEAEQTRFNLAMAQQQLTQQDDQEEEAEEEDENTAEEVEEEV